MIGLMFAILGICLVLGVPVGFAIGISATVYLTSAGFPPLSIIPTKMVDGINSFSLLALPLFIISGNIMSYGCTPRLMRFANMLLGRLPGGLGAAGVASAGFFGAISGSGVATTAAVGGLVGPEMVKQGYGKGYTASLLCAGGTLGIVIPPSLPMVIYCTSANTSVGRLFLAGVIPGLMTILSLIIFNVFIAKRRGYGSERNHYTKKQVISITVDALLPLFMPVIILGGVLTGIFTPTESAAVAVIYAFVLGKFVYRELSFKDLYKVLNESVKSSAIIMFIMACAAPFAWLMATQNIPTLFANVILSISSNKAVLMLLISFLLLVLGTFMETNSIIILMTPMLYPIVTGLGMNPIHFGVLMVMMMAIGGTTPPLAVCLFTSTRAVGITVEESFPDILYICAVLVLCYTLALVFPQIVMTLPELMMG